MTDWNVYGLGTDEHIKRYCAEREVAFADIEEKIESKKRKPEYNPKMVILKKKDLVDIVGEAFEELEIDKDDKNLILIGHGVFHHLTYGILKNKLSKAIPVINIDYHSDWLNNERHIKKREIHCGTHISEGIRAKPKLISQYLWVHDSFRNPLKIDELLLPGTKYWDGKEITEDFFYSGFFMNDKEISTYIKRTMQAVEKTLKDNFYLTIDIDVLSHAVVEIDSRWSGNTQGYMTLPTLLKIIKELKTIDQDPIGIDICGMTYDPKSFGVYDWLLETIRD